MIDISIPSFLWLGLFFVIGFLWADHIYYSRPYIKEYQNNYNSHKWDDALLKAKIANFRETFLTSNFPICIHTDDGSLFKLEHCSLCREALLLICECEDMRWWQLNCIKTVSELIRGQLEQRRYQVVVTIKDLLRDPLALSGPYQAGSPNEITLSTLDNWEDALEFAGDILGDKYTEQVRTIITKTAWSDWGTTLKKIERYNPEELELSHLNTRAPVTKQEEPWDITR
jgi:hypothetical protein